MGKRTITIEDLTALQFTGTPKLSPDGTAVVYVLTEMNSEKNGYQSSIYLGKEDGDPLKLTNSYIKDRLIKDQSPCWSPDGASIFFLSNRSEKNQVWQLPMSGGEACQVTHDDHDIKGFKLSPDGRFLVCQLQIPDKNPIEEENKDVTIVERLRYIANGHGFIKETSHLDLYDLDNKTSKRLTDGAFNAASPVFTPDGKALVYLESREEPENNGYYYDIYLLDLSIGEENLLYKGKGNVSQPQVSPDGKWVSFVGHEDGEISPKNNGIWILSIVGGNARCLTKNWDRPVGNYIGTDANFDAGGVSYQWLANSQALVFMTTVGCDCLIKQVDVNGNLSDAIAVKNAVITSFDQVNHCFT